MPPQHLETKSIFNEIVQHNEYFDNFVDMIPSNNYISGDHEPKNQKGQKNKSKDSKSSNIKAGKMNPYDPANNESTREAKKRREQANDESDDDDFEFEDNHEEEKQSPNPQTPKDFKKSKAKASPHQSRIEDLKARLRAKLEERRSNSVSNSSSDAIVSKRAARRAEKKRRVDQAKKKKSQQKAWVGTTVTGRNGLAAIKIVKDLGGSKINTEKKPMNIMDDLGGIDFGGIAGLKDDLLTKGKYSAVNKSLKNMGKKKSLERLLEEAEAKKARLRELKASDAAEDKEKAKKIEWGDTLKAASGQNTRKSDPGLLKKAMKRKAKKKAKSQEAWKSRMEQTKGKMDEKQSIRNHNIKQRAIGGIAGSNLSKKRIKDDENKDDPAGKNGEKRPRLGPHAGKGGRPGFEGKKQDFINKGNGKKNVKSQ